MKNVGMISLGCAKNRVDSEEVLSYFVRNGYNLVSDPNLADIIVINTCGFIESAKQEALDTIFSTLKLEKITIVIGCLVERYYDDLVKAIPEVDLFVKIEDYPRFGELLKPVLKNDKLKGNIEKDKRILTTPSQQAYLQISDGCNNFCAFCAIPYIRGRFRSFPFELLQKEIKDLAETGVKEIIIISQNTSVYGQDLEGDITICSVLKECLKYDVFKFIRLLYLYPDMITDEFIQLYKDEPRLTPYFDVPIQHANDRLLKLMRRHGDKALLINLFKKLREIPNAVLRTTLIVGFPTETDEDVQELKQFISDYPFDHLGVFKYSNEEGTAAYSLKDQISEKVKKERYDILMKTQAAISFKLNQKHLGEEMEVVIADYDAENFYYTGICYLFASDDIDGQIYVYSGKKELKIGEIVKVKIVNAGAYDLDGEVI
jgi:ribosomal protein S12 methylthiotransferase